MSPIPTPPIERVLAVDWSGAKDRPGQKIWLCEMRAGEVVRLENGRDRKELTEHLISEAERDSNLAVGLDFAFSFPAGFVTKRGHTEIDQVWKDAEDHGESWLRECPFPFWGKPGHKKPALGVSLLRQTELQVAELCGARPFSVFQIGGAGAVGVGSIRGMPHLRRLRHAGFAVWPFDLPATPLVIEIWPRPFLGPVVKSDPDERRRYVAEAFPELPEKFRWQPEASDDALDALVSAAAMDRHRDELAGLSWESDAGARMEGRIWLPDQPSASKPSATA